MRDRGGVDCGSTGVRRMGGVDRAPGGTLDGGVTFVLGFQHTTAMHVSIAIGLVVAYIAALDLWLIHYGPKPVEG